MPWAVSSACRLPVEGGSPQQRGVCGKLQYFTPFSSGRQTTGDRGSPGRVQQVLSVSSFPCEAPLHTPLMAGVAADLAAIVAEYHFAEPQIPLIESLGQTRLTAAAIPAFLVDELQQPVYWERTWKAVRATGFNRCIEVGSGQP